MIRPSSRAAAPGVALAFLLLGTPLAFAVDAEQVAAHIIAAATAREGTEASYDDASAVGNDVTITGLRVTGPDSTLEIETIVVANPVPRAEGGFTAETVRLGEGRVVDDEGTVTWQTGLIEGATLPSAEEAADGVSTAPMARLNITSLVIEPDDLADPVTVAGFDVRFDNFVDDTPQEIAIEIDRIELSTAALADHPEQRERLEAMGYSELAVDVAVDVGYDAGSETVSVRAITLSADEVGRLDISGSFAGMPLDQFQEQRDLQMLLENPMVERIEVRFDNSGVVERMLDLQAQEMGISADAFSEQLVGDLSMMLSMIGNPGFEEQVAEAVGAFLREPRSLRVAAAPSAPVAIMQLVALAMAAPQTLPDVLGVQIIANE